MKKSVMSATIIIFLAIFIFFIPIFERFTISDGKTGNVVYLGSIEDFKDFYISFIHSVNRTPVNEYYRIENGRFVVYKTTFYSYGAGMPDGSDNPKANIKFVDGKVEIDNIDRNLREFTVLVGTFANHTLHAANTNFELDKYVEPQSQALFKIKRVSIYDILRRQIYE